MSKTHQTEYAGATALKNVFEAENPLPGFEVGHKKVSKTRSINIHVREIGGKNNEEIVYVDSPGFEDTAGPEVDIATSVMLSQVAKKARSLRFVVLINYASLLEDRGGAMRAVLKLAHTFVSDFEEDKKSFMFLFTHATTSEFDVPELLSIAKKRLEEDVLCILEGTTDPDVQKVLKFMRKSILKKYMFVDIWHPLLSDFNDISRFVETKLSTVKNPALVSNCGLTVHAQMKLRGQLRCMLLTLRGLLSQKDISEEDEQEMKYILEMFQYFKLYIGTTQVQEAFDACEDLVEKNLCDQRITVDKALQRATSDAARFDSGHVAVLQQAVSRLAALSGHASYKYNEKRISQAFYASHAKAIAFSSIDSLETALFELDKMKAWSSGFQVFEAD